jgi:plastocyanin domain-containing protein
MVNGLWTKECFIRMKNIYTIGIIVLIVLIFGIFLIKDSKIEGNTVINKEGNIQIVKLSVEGGKYILNPSEIKNGVTVRLEADLSKMPGCSKTIVISSFNVMKTFTSTDNTVEFTPDKTGTFNIVCSMNMYKGTFTVL